MKRKIYLLLIVFGVLSFTGFGIYFVKNNGFKAANIETINAFITVIDEDTGLGIDGAKFFVTGEHKEIEIKPTNGDNIGEWFLEMPLESDQLTVAVEGYTLLTGSLNWGLFSDKQFEGVIALKKGEGIQRVMFLRAFSQGEENLNHNIFNIPFKSSATNQDELKKVWTKVAGETKYEKLDTDLRIMEFDKTQDQYFDFPLPNFNQEVGYIFQFKKGQPYDYLLTIKASDDPVSTEDIKITKGWNSLGFGNEVIFPINDLKFRYQGEIKITKDAITAGWISNRILYRNPQAVQIDTVNGKIYPGVGYWIYSQKDEEIYIERPDFYSNENFADQSSILWGKITNDAGQPMPNITVVVDFYTGKSDAEGNYEVYPLPIGSFPIRFYDEDNVQYVEKDSWEGSEMIGGGASSARDFVLVRADSVIEE